MTVRHLLYLRPIKNTLYDNGAVQRLIKGYAVGATMLAGTATALVLIVVLISFGTFSTTPVLFYRDVSMTSLLVLPPLALMTFTWAVTTTILTHRLHQSVGDAFLVPAADAGMLLETVRASFMERFPFRWVFLAFLVLLLTKFSLMRESFQLEALYGLRAETWLLIMYPLLLLVQTSLLVNAAMSGGVWVGLTVESRFKAVGLSMAAVIVILSVLLLFKWGAIQVVVSAPGSGLSSGPQPASIRASSAFNHTISLTRLAVLGEALNMLILFAVNLLVSARALRSFS